MRSQTYLALGDSMSIDLYTGVPGGGAVSQFHRWLGSNWDLDDRTLDGCRMRNVPTDAHGDIVTLTIGGNDLLAETERYLSEGLADFAAEHLALLQALRSQNPEALLIVGNVYAPQTELIEPLISALAEANRLIAENAQTVGAQPADIHATFASHEQEYLCFDIEPSLEGATTIAGLFRAAVQAGDR